MDDQDRNLFPEHRLEAYHLAVEMAGHAATT